jgi:ATP-dependent exoDNAse (exonuclease V) alpha subunit
MTTSLSEPRTVRGLIDDIEAEARDCDVLPSRAAEMTVRLTALYASVLEELTKRKMAYNRILADLQTIEEASSRAKVRAQATPEYEALLAVECMEKSTLQLIQALKVLAKVKVEEVRHLGA